MGPQGPAGPTEGWVNRTAGSVSIGTTNTTVASLSLPAGSYLLYAKASLTRASGNGSSECSLLNGATLLDQVTNQASASGEVNVVHGTVTLGATTSITFACRMTSGTANVTNRTLSAMRFTTLTVQ